MDLLSAAFYASGILYIFGKAAKEAWKAYKEYFGGKDEGKR